MAANATPPIVTRVLAERLVDDLSELDRIVWRDEPPHQGELRDLVGRATELATALLDVGFYSTSVHTQTTPAASNATTRKQNE